MARLMVGKLGMRNGKNQGRFSIYINSWPDEVREREKERESVIPNQSI